MAHKRTTKPKEYRETTDVAAGVTRLVAGLGRRVGNEHDIESLPLLVELRAEVDRQIAAAARALHADAADGRPGYSWTEIGKVLGITRQASFQRFGAPGLAATRSVE
jgi:hypothetical protein